jgi:hypothetical protein
MCEDRLPSELFEGFLACLGMPDVLGREGDEMKVMRLIDAFEWLADPDTETMTKPVRQGERFMVRRSANSKILASLLQRRSRRADPQ